MISFTVKDKPKHPIVKALREAEGNKWDDGNIVYMPHNTEHCGWSIDGYWIGYTIKSSVERLNKKEW